MIKPGDIKTGILWRLIEVVGAEFFAFCSFLVLTRLLAPEHFGVIALATLLMLIAQLILYQGVGEALVQIEDIETDWFSSGLWLNISIAALAALVLFSAAPYIASAFSEPGFAAVLRAITPLLFIYSVSGILQAKLRRDLKLKGFAFASIFATILSAIIAAIMAIQGFEVWSLVCQQWVYALTSTTMFFLHTRWMPRPFIKKAHIERLAGFSFNIIGAALLRFALRQIDLLFLGIHLPARQVGLYFLATRILTAVGQLTYYSIQRLGLPVLARLQNDPVRQEAAIASILKLTCLVCLPIFFGIVVTADLAIPIIFGADWQGSIQPFRILSLFSIVYALSLIVNQVLLSAGFASTVFRLSIMNALVFVSAIALAAPHGITITAIAGGIANTTCLPIYFYVLRNKLQTKLGAIGVDLLPIWFAASTMAIAIIAMRYATSDSLTPLLELGFSVLLGIVLFTGAIWLMRPDYVDELTVMIMSKGPQHPAS